VRSFENKVAVVTGAASGIGRALAEELARAARISRSPTCAKRARRHRREHRRDGRRVTTSWT
jgi:NAD(P)-dependent dehydrogenase (short-subunit alcohol dehydrogenase family)